MTELAWIITQGSYSDYRVLGVCKDEDTAHATAKRMGDLDDEESTSYAAVPVLDEHVKRVNIYTMSATYRRREWEEYEFTESEWEFDLYGFNPNKLVTWGWRNFYRHSPEYVSDEGSLIVKGLDQDLVRRVYSDRLAFFKSDPVARQQDVVRG